MNSKCFLALRACLLRDIAHLLDYSVSVPGIFKLTFAGEEGWQMNFVPNNLVSRSRFFFSAFILNLFETIGGLKIIIDGS